ncbi:MAG TPA: GNAT family N-acetyltransferase [Pseudonocardiaceae bacterium]
MLEIRDAQPSDAGDIAAVRIGSWQVAYRGLLPDHILAELSVPDRERTWRNILTDPPRRTAVLLATYGATVVGFAAVGPDRDSTAAPDRGELYAIYLRPDQQRRGIGTQLHNAAIDRLCDLGYTSASLWVLDGNEAAIGFYHRNGWAADGTRRVDQGPGATDLPELRRGLTRYGDISGSI